MNRNATQMNPLEFLMNSVNIPGHTNYMRDLLYRYEWPQDKKEALFTELDAIESKQKDKNLYMAVVGEFSTGKSTLINGFLRREILKMDVLQATTAASTKIIYGEELTA